MSNRIGALHTDDNGALLCNFLQYSSVFQYLLYSTANYPEKCQWEGPIKGKYLNGNDQVTLNGFSPVACKQACVEECSFHCTSFDYIPSTQRCYLHMVNRYQYALSASTSYDFYERNCFNEFKACSSNTDADWSGPLHGVSLKGFANHRTINEQTVEGCKTACLQSDGFHCRSFRYLRQNGNCYLSAYSR